jgi:transcriptional regulator with XRE-family HTH domain
MASAGVNPAMLRWARERAGLSLEEAQAALGGKKWKQRLPDWESPKEESSPTFEQARALAAAYRAPLASLFLDDPIGLMPEPGAREVNAKGCPCGGVILADTDSLRVPLCIDCHEEHAEELAAGLLNDLRRSRVECARLAADVERLRGMSDMGLSEAYSILWHALTRESDT